MYELAYISISNDIINKRKVLNLKDILLKTCTKIQNGRQGPFFIDKSINYMEKTHYIFLNCCQLSHYSENYGFS